MTPTDQQTTLRHLLEAAAGRIDSADTVLAPRPRVDRLAAFVLGVEPAAAIDRLDREPDEDARRRLDALVGRVEAGEPAAYILGVAPFFGREFEVSRDTLIPRLDTEAFLRIVLGDLRERPLPDRPRVLELCAGSGCVAVTLALELPGAEVVAVDLSAPALDVAERNVRRHGVADRVTLAQGDLFEPVGRASGGRPFDLIVSNPPYIPSGGIEAMGRSVAEHEPRLALDGGDDGLDFHRRILAEAPAYLAPGGRVFLEHEHDQGASALRIGRSFVAVYEDVRVLRDDGGRDRALAVRRR